MGQGQAVLSTSLLSRESPQAKDEALRAGNCGSTEAVCVCGGGWGWGWWYGRDTLSLCDHMKCPVTSLSQSHRKQVKTRSQRYPEQVTHAVLSTGEKRSRKQQSPETPSHLSQQWSVCSRREEGPCTTVVPVPGGDSPVLQGESTLHPVLWMI